MTPPSSAADRLDPGLGLPPGPLVGVVAAVVTYLLTFALAAVDGATARGTPAWKSAGWVFYGAHNVDLAVSVQGGETRTVGALAGPVVSNVGSAVPLPVYYLVPAAVLVLAGHYVYWLADPDLPPGQAAGVGATVLVGYAVAAGAGVVVFAGNTDALGGEATVAPDLVPAIALAGLLYPLVFGALGGAIGAWRE